MRILLSILLLAFTLTADASAADRRRTTTQQTIYPEMRIPGCVISVDERSLQYTSQLTRWKNYGSAGSASDFVGAVNPPAVSTNLNGYPIVSFDGVNDYMVNAFGTVAQPYTLIAVIQNVNNSDTKVSIDGVTSGSRCKLSVEGANYVYYAGGAGGGVSTTNSIWNNFILTINGASSYKIINAGPESALNGIGAHSSAGLTLGSIYSIGTHAKINFATILIFNRALSTAEKLWLQNWLISKYGLTF